jgi:acyl-CoA hydrolase
MDPVAHVAERTLSASEAVGLLPRTGRVAVGANAGEPRSLVAALAAGASRFSELEVVHLLSFGSEALVAPAMRGHLRVNALFIGPSVRSAVAEGVAEYTPVFLSEIPALFRPGGALPLDAALVQVTPPDRHGWCSMGVTVDVMRSAVDHAPLVIAEINRRMPRTFGAADVHVSRIHHFVAVDHALPALPEEPADPVREQIAGHVAELVDDGCTVQAGIGGVPDAVMRRLLDRRDLGIHTELLSDGMMALVRAGVATGARKPVWPGKAVTSFVLGSADLYAWVDDNRGVEMQPSDITNDPARIARHPDFVAINAALSIDLTGQVNADSIGPRFWSGIGGQVDFLRGAARSEGGRPIVSLPATAKGGTMSRIVPTLAPGAGVVTSRGDVHWVATEFGRVNLHGMNIERRARALIGLAHPAFREGLEAEARRMRWL